jgi:hypothetical protein
MLNRTHRTHAGVDTGILGVHVVEDEGLDLTPASVHELTFAFFLGRNG